MHKYTQALKVSTLALVLSFGLSYVYAWTAPTVNPPAGNVAAPVNVSATSQTKAGDIAVNGATHFLDTGTTIPSTPAGGTAAVALNGWPNFSDVAANAVKLAGLTSADILAAQTTTASGAQASLMVLYSGSAVCPTGWTKSFSGKVGSWGGTFIAEVTDINRMPSSASQFITCFDSATVASATAPTNYVSATVLCTVCTR